MDLQTRLSPAAREFYIGLWMIADDDGYLEWEPNAIGVQLYGYLSPGRRPALIAKHAASLIELAPDSPHLKVMACGHAQVPKMPAHQRISDSKRVTTVHRQHMNCAAPAPSRGEPLLPAPSRDGTGKSNGTERVNARASANEGTTEFSSRVPRPLAVIR